MGGLDDAGPGVLVAYGLEGVLCEREPDLRLGAPIPEAKRILEIVGPRHVVCTAKPKSEERGVRKRLIEHFEEWGAIVPLQMLSPDDDVTDLRSLLASQILEHRKTFDRTVLVTDLGGMEEHLGAEDDVLLVAFRDMWKHLDRRIESAFTLPSP